MIGLETEEDSATVVLENRRFDVRVNGDEAGNDGAAAHRCTIVRFEFTLTEFLKSHIHVCPHVLTSIQRDVCSLSILIVFFFFLSILCIPLDVHPFRTIYFDIRILHREKRMKQLYYYQVFRFSISTIPWFAFVKSDSYDFFLQQFSRFIFPLLIPLWHETQQFHKIEEGTFFREGEIWLIVDPGLGPRRFHVIVREGGKTWIRGGLFFFLLHAHTHTRTHTREVVGWRVNDRTMSPVWCTRTLYDDSICGWKAECTLNASKISHLEFLSMVYPPPRKRFDKGSNSFTFGNDRLWSSIETADSCLDRSVITEIRSEMALPPLAEPQSLCDSVNYYWIDFKRNGNVLGKIWDI